MIIVPGLCVPLLLGGPFLSFNRLVMDHEDCTCINKSSGYDIFNPPKFVHKVLQPPPVFSPEKHQALKNFKKSVVADLQ
jgi:hypothetical protein